MMNLESKGVLAVLRRLFMRWSYEGCPECGSFMRECRTSIMQGGKVIWRADVAHGKKCIHCGFYVPFVRHNGR
jgi:hypothetical protein